MQILSYLYSVRQDDRAAAGAGVGPGVRGGSGAGEEAVGGNGLTVRPFQNAKR